MVKFCHVLWSKKPVLIKIWTQKTNMEKFYCVCRQKKPIQLNFGPKHHLLFKWQCCTKYAGILPYKPSPSQKNDRILSYLFLHTMSFFLQYKDPQKQYVAFKDNISIQWKKQDDHQLWLSHHVNHNSPTIVNEEEEHGTLEGYKRRGIPTHGKSTCLLFFKNHKSSKSSPSPLNKLSRSLSFKNA